MKAKIRKKILDERRSLSPDEVAAGSREIAKRLFARPEFQGAKTVMFYVSRGGEVDTSQMIRKTLEIGRRVAVPVIKEEGRRLLPVLISDPDRELCRSSRGIPEPEMKSTRFVPPRDLDLIILPGVAFDRTGNRLGRGGAFYDNFLKAVRPGVPKIALAFHRQLVDKISPDPHDVAVDLIITEKTTIECEKTNRPESVSGGVPEAGK